MSHHRASLPAGEATARTGGRRVALDTEAPALGGLTSEYTWNLAFVQNMIYLCWAFCPVQGLIFSYKVILCWDCLCPGQVVTGTCLCFVFNTATPSCLQLGCCLAYSPQES